MEIIKLKEINDSIISRLSNEIFIYPTDTIYGIGCDAENKKLVEKIRKIKNRDPKPFSIIAPNTEYILQNFETDKETIEKYLPGPYTLLLRKKKKDFLEYISEGEYVGIRIPDHTFTKTLQETGKPIVTTSVNLSGEKPANKIEEINKTISEKVDLIIDARELSGKPSTLIKNGKILGR